MSIQNRIPPGSIDQLLDTRLELRLKGFEPGFVIPRDRIGRIIDYTDQDTVEFENYQHVLSLFKDTQSVFKTKIAEEIVFNLSDTEFSRKYRVIEESLKGLIDIKGDIALLLASYLKDDHGRNAASKLYHSIRVAVLSGLIAQHLADIDVQSTIEGALLHDTGQLVAPAYCHRVRFRNGECDPETEVNVKLLMMQYHPIFGYYLADSINASERAKDIVLDHHAPYYPQEYFTRDGEGPITVGLATQIVILVDRWDGLIKNRYYKGKERRGEGAGESDEGSFDPNSAALYLAACTLDDRKRDDLLDYGNQNSSMFPTLNALIRNETKRNGGSMQQLQFINPDIVNSYLYTLNGMGFIDRSVYENYQRIRDQTSL